MLDSNDVGLKFYDFLPALMVWKGHAELRDQLLKYKQCHGTFKNVNIIYGSSGIGKTSFLKLTAAKLCALSGKEVHIITAKYSGGGPGYKTTGEVLQNIINKLASKDTSKYYFLDNYNMSECDVTIDMLWQNVSVAVTRLKRMPLMVAATGKFPPNDIFVMKCATFGDCTDAGEDEDRAKCKKKWDSMYEGAYETFHELFLAVVEFVPNPSECTMMK
jgi:hypothetical protein